MKLSIVIPVFNEEGSVEELYIQINNSIKKFNDYEIVFIDDGSFDKSKKLFKASLIKTHK